MGYFKILVPEIHEEPTITLKGLFDALEPQLPHNYNHLMDLYYALDVVTNEDEYEAGYFFAFAFRGYKNEAFYDDPSEIKRTDYKEIVDYQAELAFTDIRNLAYAYLDKLLPKEYHRILIEM